MFRAQPTCQGKHIAGYGEQVSMPFAPEMQAQRRVGWQLLAFAAVPLLRFTCLHQKQGEFHRRG